jgi:hypothetical protein
VFKYKTKRNGKANTEAKDDDVLGDLIKMDKTLFFSHSTLNASERHLFREIYLHCRDSDYRLSDPIKLVIERS